MTETEKAWAAGFFDGEGSTFLARGYVRMSVVQTGSGAEVLLERFAAAVGTGNVTGPYPNGPRSALKWMWSSQSKGAELAFQALRPYLGPVKVAQYMTAKVASDAFRATLQIPHKNRTHCPHGHPYDAVNTYLRPGDGHRQCRRCRNAVRDRRKLVQRVAKSQLSLLAEGSA